MSIQVVDLFCGCGGASQGFKNAGCDVVLAVDNWSEALEVHKHNFPSIPTGLLELGGDIPTLARIIERFIDRSKHFHLHGSPPCQTLSNANTKGDPKKGMLLVNWFFELVEYMKPDSWSMENVVPVGKRIGDRYPWVKLNAADYGVPQTRIRVLAGEGWETTPSHSKDEWVSVLDALPHLKDEASNLYIDGQRSAGSYCGEIDPATGKRKWRNLAPLMRPVEKPSYTIRGGKPYRHLMVLNTIGAGDNGSRRAVSSDRDINEPSKTLNNNTPTIRSLKLEALGANANRKIDRSIEQPSKTICGSGNQVGARIFNHSLETPKKIRSLTMRETLTLQGFPESFEIPDHIKRGAAWVMIGNVVCPAIAQAIGEGIQ